MGSGKGSDDAEEKHGDAAKEEGFILQELRSVVCVVVNYVWFCFLSITHLDHGQVGKSQSPVPRR